MLLEAWHLLQVNVDVIPSTCDVSHDPRKREAAQVAVAEARELGGVRVDTRCREVAPISAEDHAELAGQLLFELMLGTWCSHPPSIAVWHLCPRIERLRDVRNGPAMNARAAS